MDLLPSASVIESLEPRLAPAGTILLTIAGGVLTITGDQDANGIVITDDPGNGRWQITDGLAGTTFKLNGITQVLPFTVEAQGSIKANMGDGGDLISLVSTTGGMVFTGGLTLNMGKGSDTINLGTSNAHNLVIKGTTLIDMGADETANLNTLTMKATTLFGGAVTLKGGAGSDTFILDSSASHSFQKGLSVDLGKGANALDIRDSLFSVQGTLTVKGGEADKSQIVKISPGLGTVDSAVSVTFSAGNSTVEIGKTGGILQLAAGLTLNGSAGTDTVVYNGDVSIAGAVTQNFKENTGTTLFTDGSSLKAASWKINAGAGQDTLFLGKSTIEIGGAFSASLGAGSNTFASSATQSLTVGSLNFTGTTGNDTISLEGSKLAVFGAATFSLGAGTSNILALNAATSATIGGNLSITGTTASDVVQIGGLLTQVSGNTTINLGNGTNILQINEDVPDAHAAFLGNFSYTGGAGNDIFIVSSAFFQVGRTLKVTAGEAESINIMNIDAGLSLIGHLTYQGGKATDQVALGGTGEDTRVAGNTSLNLGAGLAQVAVTEVQLGGKLDIKTATTATQQDLIAIKDSLIFGTTTVNLGAGAALFEVDDSNLIGDFTANLGAGVDIIKLDATDGSSDPSFWYGVVKINLGAGNDQITIGTAQPDSTNNFLRDVFVDGAAGTDTLNQGTNTFVTGSALFPTNM